MRILAILAEEEDYADELSLYIRQHKECGFTPIVFTGVESYRKFREEESESCLLTDESFMKEIGDDVPKEKICVLYKYKGLSSEGIYKFQSAEALTRDLTEWFGDKKTTEETASLIEENRRGEKGRLITFCSPEDVYLGGRAALKWVYENGAGGNTLLISFDPYFTVGSDKDTCSRMSLSDLIFLLREEKAGEDMITGSLKKGNSRIDVLCGVNSWTDIYDTEPKDITALLNLIGSIDRYDSVVVDMAVLGSPAITLMEESERIMIVSGENGDSSRIDEWRRQMKALGREDLLRRSEVLKEGGANIK